MRFPVFGMTLVLAALCALGTSAAAASSVGPDAQLKPGVFLWRGLVKGPVFYLGLDLNVPLTDRVFVPLGYDQYSGKLETSGTSTDDDPDIRIEYRGLTAGIGYAAPINERLRIPFGLRLGFGQLDFAFGHLSLALKGKSIEPFLGGQWRATERLALGFESRILLFLPNGSGDGDSDDEDDDDEGGSDVGIPQAHMLTLSFALAEPRQVKRRAKRSVRDPSP